MIRRPERLLPVSTPPMALGQLIVRKPLALQPLPPQSLQQREPPQPRVPLKARMPQLSRGIVPLPPAMYGRRIHRV